MTRTVAVVRFGPGARLMNQMSDILTKTPKSVLRERYDCLIGGELVASSSGATFATINPATGEKLADVTACTADDVSRAVEAAHAALGTWKNLTPLQRAAYCRRFAETLRSRAETYAMLDALDLGSPLQAMRKDVVAAAALNNWYA